MTSFTRRRSSFVLRVIYSLNDSKTCAALMSESLALNDSFTNDTFLALMFVATKQGSLITACFLEFTVLFLEALLGLCYTRVQQMFTRFTSRTKLLLARHFLYNRNRHEQLLANS